MTDILLRASLGTFFTFFMTSLGATTVFFMSEGAIKRTEKPFLGIAAGVMTAASIWSLLLPSIEMTAGGSFVLRLIPAAGIIIGGIFLRGLDAVSVGSGALSKGKRKLFCAITLHNIPEGMAVGIAFALASTRSALISAAALAFGIGIQNFPEGAAVSMPLLGGDIKKSRAFLIGTLSGFVEPLFGIPTALIAAGAERAMPWLMSFAAGAMLYVVADELLPECSSKWGTWGFIAGFTAMMLLDVLLVI